MSRWRYICIPFFLLLLGSCEQKNTDYLGFWKVHNDQYKGLFQIVQNQDGGYDCRLIRLDDGTTRYTYTTGAYTLIFSGLKPNASSTVDAISGATKTTQTLYQIKLKNKDTLLVSYPIMGQEIHEQWIRQIQQAEK